jgi:hypothetical protein
MNFVLPAHDAVFKKLQTDRLFRDLCEWGRISGGQKSRHRERQGHSDEAAAVPFEFCIGRTGVFAKTVAKPKPKPVRNAWPSSFTKKRAVHHACGAHRANRRRKSDGSRNCRARSFEAGRTRRSTHHAGANRKLSADIFPQAAPATDCEKLRGKTNCRE